MLYDNEQIERWDPLTGEFSPEEIDSKEDEEIKSLISDGKALAAMKDSLGWQLVQGFLVGCIQEYKDKLVMTEDFDKIQRLQSTIRAYYNVLVFVDGKINEGKSFDKPGTPLTEGKSIGGNNV